jgi:hypothetical protein
MAPRDHVGVHTGPFLDHSLTQASAESDANPAQTAKRIKAAVLDTGAIIKNEISISTLIAQADELYTTPAVVSESMLSHMWQLYLSGAARHGCHEADVPQFVMRTLVLDSRLPSCRF